MQIFNSVRELKQGTNQALQNLMGQKITHALALRGGVLVLFFKKRVLEISAVSINHSDIGYALRIQVGDWITDIEPNASTLKDIQQYQIDKPHTDELIGMTFTEIDDEEAVIVFNNTYGVLVTPGQLKWVRKPVERNN